MNATDKPAPGEELRENRALDAADDLGINLEGVLADTNRADRDPGLAAEGMEDQALAEYIAAIQDARAKLSSVESALTSELGKRLGRTTLALRDGRQATLARAADRKEWDHDDWQRETRRAAVKKTMEDLLLPAILRTVDDEGEVSALAIAPILHEAIAAAQVVHGSTAPRSRELKKLGLFATDYCTSVPSGWRLTAVKPTEKTEEPTTDA